MLNAQKSSKSLLDNSDLSKFVFSLYLNYIFKNMRIMIRLVSAHMKKSQFIT